jgi:hypothetical protein
MSDTIDSYHALMSSPTPRLLGSSEWDEVMSTLEKSHRFDTAFSVSERYEVLAAQMVYPFWEDPNPQNYKLRFQKERLDSLNDGIFVDLNPDVLGLWYPLRMVNPVYLKECHTYLLESLAKYYGIRLTESHEPRSTVIKVSVADVKRFTEETRRVIDSIRGLLREFTSPRTQIEVPWQRAWMGSLQVAMDRLKQLYELLASFLDPFAEKVKDAFTAAGVREHAFPYFTLRKATSSIVPSPRRST